MKRLVPALGLIAIALILVACSSGPGASGPTASIDPDALRISAKDLKFSTDTLTAPADEAFQIVFENQEAAPHNVAIYKDEAFGQKVFGEDPIGQGTAVYNVPAQPAATYFFRCDIHPDMKGTLTVQ